MKQRRHTSWGKTYEEIFPWQLQSTARYVDPSESLRTAIRSINHSKLLAERCALLTACQGLTCHCLQ